MSFIPCTIAERIKFCRMRTFHSVFWISWCLYITMLRWLESQVFPSRFYFPEGKVLRLHDKSVVFVYHRPFGVFWTDLILSLNSGTVSAFKESKTTEYGYSKCEAGWIWTGNVWGCNCKCSFLSSMHAISQLTMIFMQQVDLLWPSYLENFG